MVAELRNWLLQLFNIHNFKLLMFKYFVFLFLLILIFASLLLYFLLLILSSFYRFPYDEDKYLDSEKAYKDQW